MSIVASGRASSDLAEVIRDILRRPQRLLPRGLLSVSLVSTCIMSPALAVELPVPCVAGSCGSSGPGFVTSGSASYAVSGNTGTITQTTESAILNWAGFNISADGRVVFAQPSTSSIALNRIFQETPSQILGSLSTQLLSDASKSGGQVYLVNPNGIVFGATATVNAAGILASTLTISDEVFKNGLLSALQSERAALNAADGADGSAKIVVESGARISTTQANGRILLAAQNVENAGRLTADDGQVILAAGSKVWLEASDDPALRGLLVEVDAGGKAWNQVSGELSAARGNVTLVGLAVNQDGRASATTSVDANGSVRLLARDTVEVKGKQVGSVEVKTLSTRHSGAVTLGSQSRIEIAPELQSAAKAIDDQKQNPSTIEITGRQVTMRGGATIAAAGGKLNVTASAAPNDPSIADNESRIRVESGVNIDLSGSDATTSVADNIVTVELRGSELADDPYQRNGALRGKTVTIDARTGTDIANVSGAIAGIKKNVAQRTSAGGTATFLSAGDIAVADGATIDVSGGRTTYTGAVVNTSQLIRADGKLVDIGDADPTATYLGVVNPTTSVKHDRWGVVEKFANPTGSHYEAGYVEGSSAGTVQFGALAMVMNGTLHGDALNGAYQRNPSAANYADGGRLVIGSATPLGNSYLAPSVEFSRVVPNVVVDSEHNLPAGHALTLSTDYLTNGGFTRTEIYSDDVVSIPADTALTLLPGSAMTIRGRQVNVDSNITAIAGTLDFASSVLNVSSQIASGVSIADGVTLDVRGSWINDTQVANSEQPIATQFHNAGTISLATGTVNGALEVGSDVQFLANGGGWLTRSGRILGGAGGSISLLSSGKDAAFTLGDNVNLQAFGVNGAKGGSFALAAGRVQIVDGERWAGGQSYDPGAAEETDGQTANSEFFMLGSALYTGSGFRNISVTATGGALASDGDALNVASGTHINAIVDTRQLSANFADFGTGSTVVAFSNVTTLPDYQRQAASVRLAVAPNADDTSFSSRGTLRIEDGAVITGDPGLAIDLNSKGGSIEIAGDLIAKSGSITARLEPPSNALQVGYDPGLQLHVASSAVLDASGTSVLTPNEIGLRIGSVKDGGKVSLIADRGSLLIEHGARLDVSGASTALDIATGQAAQPYVRQQIGSNAGTITLTAAESIGLFGELAAHAGAGVGVGAAGATRGGVLSVALTRDNMQPPSSVPAGSEFPVTPRVLELTNAALPSETSIAENGRAAISTAQIAAAGIDDLRLAADGQILLDAGVDLTMRGRLELRASTTAIAGEGDVNLAASYVLLGSNVVATEGATSGATTLNVDAGFIDLMGPLTLQNVGTARFNSRSDIRLRGVRTNNQQVGSLNLAGDLHLEGARIYGATATQFTINAADHAVEIQRHGTAPATLPLSANSSLSINAADIVQNGTLLAPFGTIALSATDTLTLGAGSVTSVSAAGSLIPYGSTNTGGANWTYDGAPVTSVPNRQVSLNGDVVTLSNGATIDVSGGGDLYAYEFVKGTGGTTDALSTRNSDGMYAIIPALGSHYGVYDTQEFAGSDLNVGDTVYLSGAAGVPAGYYALLPARYALLPGAYLVSAVAGFTDIRPGTAAALPDGTPVVAGYRSFADTGLGGSRYGGFAIYPGKWGRELAEYRDTKASKFFAEKARNIADAGQLSIAAGSELNAFASVKSAGATGGDDATIDVAATRIEIVGTIGTGSTGSVQLDDDVLNSWQAGRLLLGGAHSADGSSITLASDSVTVAGDASVVADEVTLLARDVVAVAGSVRSTSASAAQAVTLPEPTVLNLTGVGADNAAFVSVSDLALVELKRGTQSGSFVGTVNIADGARLQTRGALIVNAPGGAQLLGALGGAGSNWSLSANHIVFADAAADGEMTIASGVLAAMETASALRLDSAGSIDFTKALVLGTDATPIDSITLAATQVQNLSAGESVELRAHTINLEGHATDPDPDNNPDRHAHYVPPATAGLGTLTLDADSIDVSGDAMSVNGFARSVLRSASQFTVSDSGTLAVGGDLDLTAARITANAASDGVLAVTGDVRLARAATTPTNMPTLELGGGLTISGTNIIDGANIVAPSGLVRLNASNQLSLDSSAVIDVSGVPVYAAGVRADSPGGTIRLNAGGDVTAASGSRLSVAGSGDEDAGRLYVNAGGTADIKATLAGAASDDAAGGSFELNAGRLTDFTSLNSALQVAGFTQAQRVHVADGDLNLAAGTVTRAHDVQLVTDRGAITVAGTISAPSTKDRGSIRLYGGSGLTLAAGGELHADGSLDGGRGGIIELGIASDPALGGRIDLRQGSVITTAGAEQGRLLLRAPAINGNDVAITSIASDLSTVGSLTLEAVLPVFSVSDAPTASDFNVIKTAATNYINAAATTVAGRLDPGGTLSYVLTPGVELQHDGDLTLGALDLSTWRFGVSNAPAALTVRATGALSVDGNLSDGFGTFTAPAPNTTVTYTDLLDGRSATMRLVAGSDLTGADPLAVNRASTADLTISAGRVVRTGTGDLSLVAAHDVVFGGVGATAYTGGVKALPTELWAALSNTNGFKRGATMAFARQGGQLLIAAGNDVVGVGGLRKSVTAWQPRMGSATDATRWGVNLAEFTWNAGALGGGDLTVVAGRDVTHLSAAAAESARENADGTALSYYGGGSLEIEAGNNLNSGMFYVGRSTGAIHADRAVATSSGWAVDVPIDDQGTTLAVNQGAMLAMGESQVRVSARAGVSLAAVVNPTVLGQSVNSVARRQSYFFTYGEESSLDLVSASADVSLGQVNALDATAAFFPIQIGGSEVRPAEIDTVSILPASVSVRALSGGIAADQALTLFPSDNGALELYAGKDIRNVQISMSDIAAGKFDGPLEPSSSPGIGRSGVGLADASSSARHVGDMTPVSIVAGRDIADVIIEVPKALQLSAGRDILDAKVSAQNLQASDLTRISAGRDLSYGGVTESGQPDITGYIKVGGPGRLDVLAGRDVDLALSSGIVTTGQLDNANIPDVDGADLTVMAGMAAGWDVNSFVDKVVAPSSDRSKELIAYVEAQQGVTGMTVSDAVAAFKSMSADAQRPLVLQQFYAELVASGREANTNPKLGYSRGYAAIDALLPGNRSEHNPYEGDISLSYSRIYTLSGGNISLFAPGGSLNVGLAEPPAGLSDPKKPGELGIVAQKAGNVSVFTDDDVLVNSSRIFTLFGGNIGIWSTLGDIDAGRGAKTSLSIPPPALLINDQGSVFLDFSGAVAGSGIRTIITDNKVKPGDVDLIAPVGFVNAGDAGIGSAGNLNIAAARVLGVDNIQVGGTAAGVPAATSGLGASLSGVSAVGGAGDSATSRAVDSKSAAEKEAAPIAQAALSWLEVFVVGLGAENCGQTDVECLKRQQ